MWQRSAEVRRLLAQQEHRAGRRRGRSVRATRTFAAVADAFGGAWRRGTRRGKSYSQYADTLHVQDRARIRAVAARRAAVRESPQIVAQHCTCNATPGVIPTIVAKIEKRLHTA